MGKYTPLQRYLEGQTGNRVTLAFSDVERIIEADLPPSARSAVLFKAWWANDDHGRHVESLAWLAAGWKRESVSLAEERVTFVRV